MAGEVEAKNIISEVSSADLDSWIRTNTFTDKLEESIRGHIHSKLQAWFIFRKLAADCSNANVSLHGFAWLWDNYAKECVDDAHWLEKYLVSRGGRAKPTTIEPQPIQWPSQPVEPVKPCKEALLASKRLLEDLERLCSLAASSGDTSVRETVQMRLLYKEAKRVKDLGDLLQQVVRVSKAPGLGIYLLDRELREARGNVPWERENDPDRVTQEGSVPGLFEALRDVFKDYYQF